jgi:hypothetical protein
VAKYLKTIVAGPLVLETVYPAPNPRDSAGVRSGKKALSTIAQQNMNRKYAYQKLELEIAANFGAGDLYITLTYDDEHLPTSRKAALARMKAFWRKLRTARRAQGQELRYLYVTEHRHGEGRWHHHALLNATGDDFDLIRQLWTQGGVEFQSIRIDRDRNYETLARYLCKEQRDKLGLRLWSTSRNLRKPERECHRVSNDTTIVPPSPEYADTLCDTGDVRTPYGQYRFIKYIVGGYRTEQPRAKRRRKRPRNSAKAFL